ncbi:hypothetical protein C5167_012173 [Papaver somniferum]|uniref:Uncharacterized protein n=1 Tax=Papaver somniferum TaxID=3469 RepID=A0A4Y7J0Y2_PAPSO|nr:hypothetical protein C5167_012173 [Papaver somniferum]
MHSLNQIAWKVVSSNPTKIGIDIPHNVLFFADSVCQVTSMHNLDDDSSILKEKLPVGKITGLKFLITV